MPLLWQKRKSDDAIASSLSIFAKQPIVAKILASRGITNREEEELFLHPSLKHIVNAEELPGVVNAVEQIMEFVDRGEKIVVFGDYDVDGVAATVILVKTLKKIGAKNVGQFIPRRLDEGYGITEKSMDRLFREYPDVALVITVDTGITSAKEVQCLIDRGVRVVITDHHLPGEEIPKAHALVNPRISSVEGCDDLCAAGVAFYLATALVNKAISSGRWSGKKFGAPLLVLAGLATVADMVSLTKQNRILVNVALNWFSSYAPIGLRELLKRAQRFASNVTVHEFSFALAPRINAAGRIATADKAYELLFTENQDEAQSLAVEVDTFNVGRKSMEQEILEAACNQLQRFENKNAVVVSDTGLERAWHSGVVGILASRLVEKTGKPVAVVTKGRGSLRVPAGYNAHDVLSYASSVLDRFGGHVAAGGFTVAPGKQKEFEELFEEACTNQKVVVGQGVLEFDEWLNPSDITMEFLEDLKMLAPYGEGNPEPVFGLKSVHFKDVQIIGSEGKHLSITFAESNIPRAVWWGQGEMVEELRKNIMNSYDILFKTEISTFGYEPHPELRIVDIRES